MALIHIEKLVIQSDEKLLKEILCKVNQLLETNGDTEVIVKATEDLDATGNALDKAVKDNTPQ